MINKVILEALDTLALALTEHDHQWTHKERSLYSRAVRSLDAQQSIRAVTGL